MKRSPLDFPVSAIGRVVALKIDVDTYGGMNKGVPALLDLLARHMIKASFFVPMGKDHTGRTVKRVFTRKGFLSKVNRAGPLRTYGLKTLLYGILLPGPQIARHHGPLLKRMTREGHEVGIHGLDHVFWHDHIRNLGPLKTATILREAFAVYKDIFGWDPLSFAAPGWVINKHALEFLKEKGCRYSSDVRGHSPFFPVFGGTPIPLIQIPTTLPTLDEVVGLEGTGEDDLAAFFVDSLKEGLNVLTIHAELEGKHWAGFLDRFIKGARSAGCNFMRLLDVSGQLEGSPELIPFHEMVFGPIKGRAGEVLLQGQPCQIGRLDP